MGKTLRIGFIGAGGIAHLHARHLKKIEQVELVAAADTNATNLGKFTEAFPGVKPFSDSRDLLKSLRGELDAVCVCTPNGLHAENTVAAFDAGLHVMVEKPMAMTARQCQQMIDAGKKAGRHLVVGFQFRFDPRTELIRKQIAEGHFGKILYVRCQALRRRGIPNWGVFGRKELQGGGPMIDIGVHVLEMAHFAIGAPAPLSATGNCWTFYGNKPTETVVPWPNWDHSTYNVEDFAAGMIRLDGGTMLTIEASFVAHIEKDVWTFQVMGETGGATWDQCHVFTDQAGYMVNLSPGYLPQGGWDAIWDRKMKHFVDVIRDGKPNQSPGEHGLMVQKMLDGVYLSAEQGREVPLG